jgi:NAD(P)-dependent dehydrogenase (short-subunit alcohol dehydrogenase family)
VSRPVAIVTGGASGIGKATCDRLLGEDFLLAVYDINQEGADAAAGPDGLGLVVDVADDASVDKAVAATLERFGRIDVLVNNAGITGNQTATRCHETPVEEFDKVMGVNVRGIFLCARAVLPTMIEQGSGHIITLASVAGLVVFPGRNAYVTSKGAALMFAKSLAVDYARDGIRSNAICPGAVYTPMMAWRLDQPELREKIESQIPMGRTAQPEEIAEAITLLAIGKMAYMNGTAVVLDGGWTSL